MFSLTNDKLKNKTEIVKTLLAHGADPSVVQHLVPSGGKDDEDEDKGRTRSVDDNSEVSDEADESPLAGLLRQSINPAIRYYLGRQGATNPNQLAALQNGHYDPLLGARFYLVGQDLALDEMMRAVASHARRKEKASLALVFSWPFGAWEELPSLQK